MTENLLHHSSNEISPDPAAGETLLPEHAERNPKELAEEAAVETQSRMAQAEAAVENSGPEAANKKLEQLAAEDQAAETGPPAPPRHVVNSELKGVNLRHGLQQIQRQETTPQRALSHVIHQPVMRVLSETASKTISRPSGLLGGGLVAFLGSSGYVYLAKHSGSAYNYLVFLLLFAGGFVVGLLLELVVYTATSSVRHRND